MKMDWRGLQVALFIGIISACSSVDEIKETEVEELEIKHTYTAFSFERQANIEKYFDSLHQAQKFYGNILFRKGDSLYYTSYGMANYEKKELLKPESRFELASVSKPITAIAIMQLLKENNISLETKLLDIFEDWPYSNISIRHLLSHRSGLPNYMYLAENCQTDPLHLFCNTDVVQLFTRSQPDLWSQPDKKFNYCNTNYALLASVIEEISKMPYEDYLLNNVFAPVGMDSSFAYSDLSTENIPGLAQAYSARFKPFDPFFLNGTVGDKRSFSTLLDLLKLDRALYNGELLADSIIELMYEPQTEFNRKRQSYGLGWRLRLRDNGQRVVFHNGWWRGYRNYFIRIPEEDKCIIVLGNVMRGSFLSQESLLELLD
jgi:CubicO group peptidase (beta-lactamase class C family)